MIATDITDEERQEIDRAIAADEILSDEDIAAYVAASTIAELLVEAEGNPLLAKRLLAGEQAREKPRITLTGKLCDMIESDREPDPGTPDDGTRTIKRGTALAWWCPCCDHSQLHSIETCANCGAQRRGDKVTIPVREAA